MRRTAIALAALLLLIGCDDPAPAKPESCRDDTDCPGTQRCADRVCVPARACDAGLGCCALEACQGGVCAPAPTDDCAQSGCLDPDRECQGDYCVQRACADDADCAGGRCLAGLCLRETPCAGACTEDQACYAHRGLCRRAPPQCAQSCAAGEVRIVLEPDRFNGPQCALDQAVCACVGAPPLGVPTGGRQARMGVVDGQPVFAAYDPELGDLLFIEDPESDTPTVTWLDGVPDEPPTADPQGPRGGVTGPGPNRGHAVRLAADDRHVHIAYYDVDSGALRYIRRDGATWTQPQLIDDEGDAGRYIALALDAEGKPHIAYTVVATVDGRAGLRYAVAQTPTPMGPGDWRGAVLSMRNAPAEATPLGDLPRVHGVRPCLAIAPNGDAVVGFHNAEEERFYLARGDLGGFQIFPLDGVFRAGSLGDPGGRYDDVLEHPLGAWCAIVAGAQGVQAVFTDDRTWALLSYRGPVDGGGEIEVVDPGGSGQRRKVGAEPALAFDADFRAVVVYQDATDNDLRLNVRAPQGWGAPPLVIADDGPLGFANSLIIRGAEAWAGTLALETGVGGRVRPRLRVVRVPLP